jgi:hypothetical protein
MDFKFMNVFGYRRLGNKQLLSRFGKTQPPGDRIKNLQTEIKHLMKILETAIECICLSEAE